MQNSLTLGQKILKFRLQTGKSQYDLELEMGASPGTISRIEKGKTNPSKETLQKIVEILTLNEFEAMSLFNISTDVLDKVFSIINEFEKAESIESVVKVATDKLEADLKYKGSNVLLLEKDYLVPFVSGTGKVSNDYKRLTNASLQNIKIPLSFIDKNILVKSALENKIYESSNLFDFTRELLTTSQSYTLAKVMGFVSAIAVPLRTERQLIGTLYLSKSGREDYEFEKPVVQQIATQLAIKIESIRQIEHFKQQLKNAK